MHEDLALAPGCRGRRRWCRRDRSRSCAPCAVPSWGRGRADHLVVLPQRAVEQHDRGAGQPPLQARRSSARSRGCRAAACPSARTSTPTVSPALPASSCGDVARLHDRARPCPARRTARPRARCRCRRHGAARTAGRAAPPRGARSLGQHAEDRIGLQHAEHPLAAIDGERLAFAHDAADPRSHRRRRRSGSRLRSARNAGRVCGWRIACAWICWRRSGEALIRNQRSPSPLTASDAWVRGASPGIAGARATARFGVGVPLGEAAAGGGPQDDGPHRGRPRPLAAEGPCKAVERLILRSAQA